jgi:tetratricopeptide (TPR) repeat protein
MSKYICKSHTCAIAISKAAFPVIRNCPVCQQALSEEIENFSISEVDELLIAQLPYVIAFPLKRTLLEKHPWTKINLLKDTFLNYLKYIGLIAASEFFNSSLNERKMVALFQQTLAEPSFGSWNQFIRETLSYLKENNHSFFCEDLVSYYDIVESGKKRKLYKGEIQIIDSNGDVLIKKQEATAIGMLINFRNRHLGHGLTLDESDAINHWETYFPIFRELLKQMDFTERYPMFKFEHGESYLLMSSEISLVEKGSQTSARVWLENPNGNSMDILPFFVVPGEVSIGKEGKEQLLTYESYTGKTIKFFSPEGTEKQTSGKILEKLNLLLRDKQKETPFAPEAFTKDEFLKRIAEENKLLLETLISEKKIIPGIYQHREEMEIKLREWIGARANIFFIVAEAGSGKTNLLVEIQRQYTERDLPSLLIRAGRMEKQSLKEQIAYLLNIDLQQGLVNYKSIAGTQSQPTFILIDGLNEANNAEEVWQEIIDLSKLFILGCLKFVITCRAKSTVDIQRYVLSENDEILIYGENKDRVRGSSPFVFWLTSLNMVEMKGAWENYVRKDKNKYNPLFLFDELAIFDRSLYNQISNPLVLRLFLETYNGKSLPKNVKGHLNIWKDWLSSFAESEKGLLSAVAEEIWNKGTNELLLDDLLKEHLFIDYLTNDSVNSPYPRLKNKGWISRYVKDLYAYISITVEGALFHLLGQHLSNKLPVMKSIDVVKILSERNKLKQASVEEFLCYKASEGELRLVIDLIDINEEYLEICLEPLIIYMKSFGSEALINQLLKNETENDWKCIYKLDALLIKLQVNDVRKEFLTALMMYNTLDSKYSLLLGMKAILLFDKDLAAIYIEKISKNKHFTDDLQFLEASMNVEIQIGSIEKAIEIQQQILSIEIEKYGEFDQSVIGSLCNLGTLFDKQGNYEKALVYLNRALKIQSLNYKNNSNKANIINTIGSVWHNKGNFNLAIDYYNQSLNIYLKLLGSLHPYVASVYNNIALSISAKGDLNKALHYHQMALEVQLKTLGDWDLGVSTSYNNIGIICKKKGDYDQALDYYKKGLEIDLKKLGNYHTSVGISYLNIGNLYNVKGDYENALNYFKLCLEVFNLNLDEYHPLYASLHNNFGSLYDNIKEYNEAIKHYEICIKINLKVNGNFHADLAVNYNNLGLTYKNMGNSELAINNFLLCEDIMLKSYGKSHHDLIVVYDNLGVFFDENEDFDKALEYFTKSLQLKLEINNHQDDDLSKNYFRIAWLYSKKEKYYDALENYYNCLSIESLSFDENKESIAITFNNIAVVYENINDFQNSIENYYKCLDIRADILGEDHQSVSILFFNIGRVLKSMNKYEDAIEMFNKGYKNFRKGGFPFNIAECYEKLEAKLKAFDYFLESAEIRKNDPDFGLNHNSTAETIQNAIRLAKELNKESDLPDWMKNTKL